MTLGKSLIHAAPPWPPLSIGSTPHGSKCGPCTSSSSSSGPPGLVRSADSLPRSVLESAFEDSGGDACAREGFRSIRCASRAPPPPSGPSQASTVLEQAKQGCGALCFVTPGAARGGCSGRKRINRQVHCPSLQARASDRNSSSSAYETL